MKDCLLWEGPHAGAREECEESCPESSRDNRMNWLPEEVENLRMKLCLGRRKGCGKGIFRFGFSYFNPTQI